MMKNFFKKIDFFWEKISERQVDNFIKRLINEDFTPNNHTFFIDPQEINHWGKKSTEYFNQKEKEYNESIFYESSQSRDLYPFAVFNWYCGYYYLPINKYLRGHLNDNHDKNRIEIMTNEINQFGLEQEMVCVRRVSNTFFEKYLLKNRKSKTGVIFADEAFTSTSLDVFYRKDNDSKYKPLKNETLLFLKLKRGTNAIYLESVSQREEYELLLNRGINFQIEKTKNILGNRMVVARSL